MNYLVKGVWSILVLFMMGCTTTSPSVTYYTLQSISHEAQGMAANTLSIAVGPAEFPAYLQRDHIVTRLHNRLEVHEYERWGASFENTVLSAFGENIRRLLNTSRIVVYPAVPRFPIDYRIVMDVIQFDGSLGNEVTLNVRWMILDPTSKSALDIKQSQLAHEADDKSYDTLVDVYSLLIAQLSEEMAEAIRTQEILKVSHSKKGNSGR